MATENSTDTETLDEKKQNLSDKKKKDIPTFFIDVAYSILSLLVFTFFSSYILYCSHLAKQKIVPDDLDAYPYKPGAEKQTNSPASVVGEENKQILGDFYSIDFPMEQANPLLDFLHAEKEKGNVVSKFVFKQLICTAFYNLQAFMFFFQFLQGWNENLIIILGPILFAFFVAFLFIFGSVLFVYYYFMNMSILTQNTSTILNILFPCLFICFLVCCFFIVFVFQIGAVVYVFAMTLCFTSNFNNRENQSMLNFFTLFVYHFQNLFMVAVGVIVTSTANADLGVTETIASIGILIMIASGMLGIQMFQNPPKKKVSEIELTSVPQQKQQQEQQQQGGGGGFWGNQRQSKRMTASKYQKKQSFNPEKFKRMLKEFHSMVASK